MKNILVIGKDRASLQSETHFHPIEAEKKWLVQFADTAADAIGFRLLSHNEFDLVAVNLTDEDIEHDKKFMQILRDKGSKAKIIPYGTRPEGKVMQAFDKHELKQFSMAAYCQISDVANPEKALFDRMLNELANTPDQGSTDIQFHPNQNPLKPNR